MSFHFGCLLHVCLSGRVQLLPARYPPAAWRQPHEVQHVPARWFSLSTSATHSLAAVAKDSHNFSTSNMSITDSDAPHSGAATPTTDDHIIQILGPLLSGSAFTCGGSILVKVSTDTSEEGEASPMVIRWDNDKEVKQLVLPAADISTIEGLVGSTQPAGFGFKGKNVIDESYRKASKLDPSAFSTNFCPYEVGIIDAISQTLLPLPKRRAQGIRAELYKLNVRTSGLQSGLLE